VDNVLLKDDNTAVVDMCAAPDDARIVYAATNTFQLDLINRRAIASDARIYKSIDEG